MGSQAEKLKASKCFLLFPQQRTSRPRYVSLVPNIVASTTETGLSVFKNWNFFHANQAHDTVDKSSFGDGKIIPPASSARAPRTASSARHSGPHGNRRPRRSRF